MSTSCGCLRVMLHGRMREGLGAFVCRQEEGAEHQGCQAGGKERAERQPGRLVRMLCVRL